jgi:hypothetical protein
VIVREEKHGEKIAVKGLAEESSFSAPMHRMHMYFRLRRITAIPLQEVDRDQSASVRVNEAGRLG